MARAVDPRRTRKALRALEKLRAAKTDEDAPLELSSWEADFVAGVYERLETYGSAFADAAKGAPEEALSRLQSQKLKELSRKAKEARSEGAPGASRAWRRSFSKGER